MCFVGSQSRSNVRSEKAALECSLLYLLHVLLAPVCRLFLLDLYFYFQLFLSGPLSCFTCFLPFLTIPRNGILAPSLHDFSRNIRPCFFTCLLQSLLFFFLLLPVYPLLCDPPLLHYFLCFSLIQKLVRLDRGENVTYYSLCIKMLLSLFGSSFLGSFFLLPSLALFVYSLQSFFLLLFNSNNI